MLSKDKIDRINQLYRKSKNEGLTDLEKKEQKKLREEYLQSARRSMKSTLLNVTVVDKKGNDVTPNKLIQEKEKKKKH